MRVDGATMNNFGVGDISANILDDDEQLEQQEKIREERRLAMIEADAEAQESEAQTTSASATGVNLATSNLLRWAWLALIPSFGLSLIWINIHVFLSKTVSDKFFCKLGEEWGAGLKNMGAKDAVAGFGKAGKAAGMLEWMALIALDLAAILIILIAIGSFMVLMDIITGIFGWVAQSSSAVYDTGVAF